jgi:[ribosomal protein S5]-alanine N-acetyltransferase
VNLNAGPLLLREFAEADWEAMLAYQRDGRYLRFYPWTERRAEEVQVVVQRFVAWRLEWPRTKYQLALELPGQGGVIGTCGVRMESSGACEAEIGYEVDANHWGRGYATAAAKVMLAFAFEGLRLHRVWATCISDNVASLRVLEKLGMQREGRLREHQWFKGRRWDSFVYGILEPEWAQR